MVKSQEEDTKPIEIISLDIGEEGEETPGLDEETTLDLLEDALEETYSERIAENTNDKEIQESLAERQNLDAGHEKLENRLEQHNAKSSNLTAGDIDAAWDKSGVGDETPGGTVPTPDQDVVDEIGEAVGLTYEDDEPLHTGEKLAQRDQERWELNPDSAAKSAE